MNNCPKEFTNIKCWQCPSYMDTCDGDDDERNMDDITAELKAENQERRELDEWLRR